MRLTILPFTLILLAKFVPERNACIYFLLRYGTVVYVGQTKDLECRMKQHERDEKIPYDDYRAIVAPWNNCNRRRLELAYIAKFRPLFNIQGKPN